MEEQSNELTGLELIKGVYTTEEAREVLMSLISNKLRFHGIKNLQAYETTGREDPKSGKRIKELKQLRERLLTELQEAKDEGLNVELHANIDLKFRESVNS